MKNDFPRIPWPTTGKQFWKLVKAGGLLRTLHLMEADAVGDAPYPFIGEGSGMVDKIIYEDGRVWINPQQYFETVPLIAWEFTIGGYRPAYKWLKDRRGTRLEWQKIGHYQSIIRILVETDKIMKTIKMAL